MTTSERKRDVLSAAFVRAVKETGTYSDGNGLNLRVDESGAKRLFRRVTVNGKRRNLGLGRYPSVSLAEARRAAWANATMIGEGRAPIAEKQEERLARQRPPTPTFAKASEIVIEMRRPTWSNAKHAAQWSSTLETYAFPKIGSKLVTDIASADILAGDAPSQGEEASPEGPGGNHGFTQTDAVIQRPVGQFHFATFAHFDVANDTRSAI